MLSPGGHGHFPPRPPHIFLSASESRVLTSQMGHENAKIVNRVNSKWIAGMKGDPVAMLNSRLSPVRSPNTNGNGKCH